MISGRPYVPITAVSLSPSHRFDLDRSGPGLRRWGQPVPGATTTKIMRASYAMESVTLDGEPVELAFQADRHRVAAVISDERPAGRHTAVFSYSVSGGSMPTRDGWRTHIRLLNRGHEADDVITIEAAPGVAAIGVRCVTFAPDAYPCGSKAADQSWSISMDQSAAPEYVVTVRGDPRRIAPPKLDRT